MVRKVVVVSDMYFDLFVASSPGCLTWTVSHGLSHLECLTRVVSPGLSRLGCLTQTVSPGLSHLDCLTWNASPGLSLSCLTWVVSPGMPHLGCLSVVSPGLSHLDCLTWLVLEKGAANEFVAVLLTIFSEYWLPILCYKHFCKKLRSERVDYQRHIITN